MKANAYGTLSEQSRFRRGYRQAKAISKDDVRRCRNCRQAQVGDKGALRCLLDGYAVGPGGQCLQWAARTAEGLRIREGFVVGDGYESLLTADYS